MHATVTQRSYRHTSCGCNVTVRRLSYPHACFPSRPPCVLLPGSESQRGLSPLDDFTSFSVSIDRTDTSRTSSRPPSRARGSRGQSPYEITPQPSSSALSFPRVGLHTIEADDLLCIEVYLSFLKNSAQKNQDKVLLFFILQVDKVPKSDRECSLL